MEGNGSLGEPRGVSEVTDERMTLFFTLQGICALRKSQNGKTFLTFLDVSKACDGRDYFTYYGKIVFRASVVNS